MALGNNNSFGGKPLIYLNPRSKDKDGNKIKPVFAISRVNEDGKIEKTNETCNNVSGELIRLDYKEREVRTKAGLMELRKSSVLLIRDGEETYYLDVGFTIAGRGLFNSLASLTENGDFTGLEISIYRNKNEFESFCLKKDGQLVRWKYSIEELPKAEPILDKRGKKLQNDYSEIDDVFVSEVNKISEKLGSSKKKSSQENSTTKDRVAPKQAAPKPNPTQTDSNVDDSEDIPF